ncbi:MAG: phosphomannomutase/phosphoglucomutase, partial [Thermoproteota archaeon]
LRRMVAENGYDLGVGYDGDADRALFVDDKGSVLRGDIVLSLFVKHFLKDRPGEKIVYEVSCSKVVEEVCRENGVIPIISRIGHAFILGKMIDENAVFGGEISSHLYFGEMHGIDDAIFATLKVAELLSLTGRKLSSLVAELPKYESFRKNYDVPDAIKFKLVESIKNRMVGKGYRTITIDGVRVELENGWFIFRASNTLPQVKLTAEAKTRRELDTIVSFAEQLLKEELSKHS